MRAIRVKEFGSPAVMQLAEIPTPEPGPGQLVVQIHAAGVNPVDTYIRAGTYAKKPELPYTPGMDGAGIVLDVGAAVKEFRPGQRVYLSGSITGTYAAAALCEAAHVHPMPESVSFSQGAALGIPYATAHFALLTRAAAQAGETVLIHGATGGVGLAAVQIARAAGLKVFATGGSEEGRRLLREEGAHEVFDHGAAGYLKLILEKSGGVDVVLEMLANVNLANDLTLLSRGGRVAVIGSRGPIEINPRELMARNADVRGVMLAGSADPLESIRIHAALYAGLENKTLRPVVAREYPLGEASQAHEAVMASGARGKIVLLPQSE
ncbi:MAG: quinone oxidoreductase [Chthoniobacteraceae bacterium]|nr:quinone oxidoreductase [Chthoniobacteraceae bacterium]